MNCYMQTPLIDLGQMQRSVPCCLFTGYFGSDLKSFTIAKLFAIPNLPAFSDSQHFGPCLSDIPSVSSAEVHKIRTAFQPRLLLLMASHLLSSRLIAHPLKEFSLLVSSMSRLFLSLKNFL